MKVAVLGAGAMGQLFGAHLKSADHEVLLIDVFAETCKAINERGIRVSMGSHEVYAEPRAALAHEIDGPVELILVMTKGPQTREALASVQHLIGQHTQGLSLQNGLGNEEPLTEFFGAENTVIGMTDYPANRQRDGIVASDHTGHVVVGEVHPRGQEKAQNIARLLHNAGLNASYCADIKIPIWEKVIFNSVFNTVSAATGLRTGEVFAEREAQVLAEGVLKEALHIAQREGITIDEKRLRNSIRNAHTNHAAHKPSMLVDIEAGRQTEIESIGGAVEKAGRQQGIATPYLSVLCNVIRLRERSRRS